MHQSSSAFDNLPPTLTTEIPQVVAPSAPRNYGSGNIEPDTEEGYSCNCTIS